MCILSRLHWYNTKSILIQFLLNMAKSDILYSIATTSTGQMINADEAEKEITTDT